MTLGSVGSTEHRPNWCWAIRPSPASTRLFLPAVNAFQTQGLRLKKSSWKTVCSVGVACGRGSAMVLASCLRSPRTGEVTEVDSDSRGRAGVCDWLSGVSGSRPALWHPAVGSALSRIEWHRIDLEGIAHGTT